MTDTETYTGNSVTDAVNRSAMNERAKDRKVAASAEEIARDLSHMQILDIVHVRNHGHMKVSRYRPAGATGALIDAHILTEPSAVRNVHPGVRFQPVLQALYRSGRIARPVKGGE